MSLTGPAGPSNPAPRAAVYNNVFAFMVLRRL